MFSRKMLIWVILLLMPGMVAAQPEEVTGGDILAKSAEAYSKISRYVGTSAIVTRAVIQVSETKVMDSSVTANAKIEFTRGSKIKIEGIQTYGGRYSIVGDGKTATVTHMLDGKEQIQKDLELELAIASMTGVTGGAATNVPAALLDTNFGNNLSSTTTAPQMQGVEKIGIWECYKVVGFDPTMNTRNTFWIDRKNFLMRQYLTEQGEINLDGVATDEPEVRESLEEMQQLMKKTGMKSITTLHIIGIEEAQ